MTETAETVLATEGLSIRFGGQVAVDGITTAFHSGTLTAIIGPNGAGKTTYFNLISGQLRPSAGRIILRGADITRAPASRRARLGLARGFQLTNLFLRLTALENVRLAVQSRTGGGRILTRRVGELRRERDEAAAILDRVGLASKAALAAAALSLGEQRKLELALLLALDARAYLFDEPTAGMDADDVLAILDLISQIAGARDKAVLLVEHNLDVVRALADRIIVLADGRLVADGEPTSIMATDVVQRAYLGEPVGHA